MGAGGAVTGTRGEPEGLTAGGDTAESEVRLEKPAADEVGAVAGGFGPGGRDGIGGGELVRASK